MDEPTAGMELEEEATGSRLRFLRTRGEGGVRMEITAPAGWSAGPLHVHPKATERLTVLDGRLCARLGRERSEHDFGGVVSVPPGTPHTVAALTAVRMLVEFEPPLRTDRMFFEMYGGGSRATPPRALPSTLRAWLEARGYRDEIRYLWPRRVLTAAALLATARPAAVLLRRATRRRRGARGAARGRAPSLRSRRP